MKGIIAFVGKYSYDLKLLRQNSRYSKLLRTRAKNYSKIRIFGMNGVKTIFRGKSILTNLTCYLRFHSFLIISTT